MYSLLPLYTFVLMVRGFGYHMVTARGYLGYRLVTLATTLLPWCAHLLNSGLPRVISTPP